MMIHHADNRTSEPEWRVKLDALGDEIATMAAHVTAAEYRLLCKIREFDEAEGWYHHGARSCAEWLNWRIGLGLVAAREKVRVARALASLPEISAAMERGALSYSKVRALTRVATPETEEDLLDSATKGTASHVEKMVRLFRQACRPDELARAAEQQAEKYLRTYWDDDGMLVIDGRLPPEEGALVEAALEEVRKRADDSAESRECESDNDSAESSRRSWAAQHADALVGVAEAALLGPGSPQGARAQVTVHVDAEVLADPGAQGRCELEDGAAIAADTMRRLACDSDVLALVHGENGQPLGPGRRTRRVTSRLRRALWQRDRGCAFPGCTCTRFLHAHHVQHWAEGGPTHLDNLVMLCRHHHRLVHEGGLSVGWLEGEPRFRDPCGRPVELHLRVAPIDGDPLIQWRDAKLDAQTMLPDWEGESPDYDEMLRPLFERGAG